MQQFAFLSEKDNLSGGMVATKFHTEIDLAKISVDGRFANPVAVDPITRTTKQNHM